MEVPYKQEKASRAMSALGGGARAEVSEAPTGEWVFSRAICTFRKVVCQFFPVGFVDRSFAATDASLAAMPAFDLPSEDDVRRASLLRIINVVFDRRGGGVRDEVVRKASVYRSSRGTRSP